VADQSLVGGTATFDTAIGVTRFALISLLCATPISALIGVGSLSLAGYADPARFASIWMTWWLGDAAGALVITPVIALWVRDWSQLATRRELFAGAAGYAGAGAIGLIAFSPLIKHAGASGPLGFLAILPLIWAALYRNQRDTRHKSHTVRPYGPRRSVPAQQVFFEASGEAEDQQHYR
jgi:integral membrane sensor domain MASE1